MMKKRKSRQDDNEQMIIEIEKSQWLGELKREMEWAAIRLLIDGKSSTNDKNKECSEFEIKQTQIWNNLIAENVEREM